MKRFFILLVVLCLLPFSVFASSWTGDPILGAWYIMLDYNDYPDTAETAGKEYMLYILIFEKNGTVSGISGESTTTGSFSASGSVVGKWEKKNDNYSVSIVGLGVSPAEFSGDRLLLRITENVWYSLRKMDFGDWFTDLVFRY